MPHGFGSRKTLQVAVIVLAGCMGDRDPSLLLDTTPFAALREASVTLEAEPPVFDTLVRIGPESPFFPATDLAVAPDGTVAIAHHPSCRVAVYGGDGVHFRTVGGCEEKGGIRRMSDVFWVGRDTLGVFDIWNEELHVYRSTGEKLSGYRVPVPPGGVLTQAFPTQGGVLISWEPIEPAEPTRLLRHIRTLEDGSMNWAVLQPPSIALSGALGVPSGVEACLSPGIGAPSHFAALNRRVFELVVGTVGDSTMATHSVGQHSVPALARLADGRLGPAPGSYALGCGEAGAIALRVFWEDGRGGPGPPDGFMEFAPFDESARLRWEVRDHVLASSRAVGLDSEGRIYALTRVGEAYYVLRSKPVR